MLTTPLVQKISLLATEQPYLHIDDVFVGILVSKVDGTEYLTVQNLSASVPSAQNTMHALCVDLYYLYYRSYAIFYHVPAPQVFSDWWLCDEKNDCAHPNLGEFTLQKLIIVIILVFLCGLILNGRRRRLKNAVLSTRKYFQLTI